VGATIAVEPLIRWRYDELRLGRLDRMPCGMTVKRAAEAQGSAFDELSARAFAAWQQGFRATADLGLPRGRQRTPPPHLALCTERRATHARPHPTPLATTNQGEPHD
jgi:hypothetical protein